MDALKDLAEWLTLEVSRAKHAATLSGIDMASTLNTGSASALPSVASSLCSLTRYQARHDALVDVLRQVEALRARGSESQ